MNLSKAEILSMIEKWLKEWDAYNLDGVMELMHEDISFENWTGNTVYGKKNLQRLWTPWFLSHNKFKFLKEDIFVDIQEQKVLFKWRLEWPSTIKEYRGKTEIRNGVDILHFKDKKIIEKLSYSKTSVQIDEISVSS